MTNICVSFSNIKILFDFLNSNCEYLVLRNWDDVFNDSVYGNGHEDIDILCADLSLFIEKTSARRVYNNPHRDNFVISCGDGFIRFDIRWVGDGYYPVEWEKRMLDNRQLSVNGVYIMNPEDYCYSLSYHALVQKPKLSAEYYQKVNKTFKMIDGITEIQNERDVIDRLYDFMNRESYRCVIPQDPGVFINWTNFNKLPKAIKATPLFRRSFFRFTELLKRLFNKLRRNLGFNK